MAGGATTKTTPWPTQEPYLEKGFKQAERIYDMNQGMGTPYFGGPTVAGFDPAQEAAQGGVLGYATGPRPGVMQAGTEQALRKGLQGGQGVNYGAGSPFSAMMETAQERVRDKLLGETLPGIREAMVYAQPGGGSRGNQLQDKAVAAASKEFAGQIADQWGSAWNTAQAQVPDYMRMSGQVQQTPLGMYGAMADVGAERRAMTQEGINRAMAKHDWEQAAPQRALQNYLASVTGDYGSVVTQSQQPNFLGAIGGLLGGFV